MIDNLPDESNNWINTRHLLIKEHLIGKPTLLVNINYFPSVLNYLKNLDFMLENRANIIGFGSSDQPIDTLRNYILYHEFSYPVFKKNSKIHGLDTCDIILQLVDQEGNLVSTYYNEMEIFEKLVRDTNDIIERSIHIQMKEFEWQRLDKPIERLLQPQTLFQYPTFLEKSDKHLFISDTFHNRIVKMKPDGHVDCVYGDGFSGFKDGFFSECKFYRPQGLFHDIQQNQILVADTNNNTIRRIDLIENFVSTFINSLVGDLENYLLRDDTTRIMLTEEYIEKQFILEREKEWLKNVPKPITIDFTACSKAISRPIDLFINYDENCLYIAEMGYKHIWKIDLANGIVEDVLPIMIHKYLRNDFTKYLSQVFPSIDISQSRHNLFAEFYFLKHRSLLQKNTSFHYIIESPTSLYKPHSENQYKFKQIKVSPSPILPSLNGDDLIESVACNTIFASTEIGFNNGSIINEEKPEFNHPTSIIKMENNLFISDSFNHVIRKLSAISGQTETIVPSNLAEFGVIASENHPNILPDGNLDENNRCGRLVIAEKMDFVSGSCLLKLFLKTPKNFKFIEKISSTNIDITFKNNGRILNQHTSYVHNPTLFDPESFSITDDSDWKSIKRKNRAYTSLPDLVADFKDDEMVLNIPFELEYLSSNEKLELDVTFTTFIGSTLSSRSTHRQPFTLQDHLHTVSYAPFNLQTFNLSQLLNLREISELEAEERKEIRHKISQILEWNLQESITSPHLKEHILENNVTIANEEQDNSVIEQTVKCNDSSQVFVDCVTLRIPIHLVEDSQISTEKKRKLLIHGLTIPVSPFPPIFKQNHHKHQYVATTSNI